MASIRPDAVIVGAGIIGLATAIRLAESDFRVQVYADRWGPGTSSFAAGAIFAPQLADHPRRDQWAEATRRELERCRADRQSWVRSLDGIEGSRVPMPPPADARGLPGYRECTAGELPIGFASGWHYQALTIDMPAYLEWLKQRLADLAVSVHTRRVTALSGPSIDADIVVNCSGAGARTLALDGEVYASSGQLVLLRNPGLDTFFVEHHPSPDLEDSTYLIPQGDLLLLGGSAGKVEPDLDLTPDTEIADAIVRRCQAAFPALLADVEIVGHRIGARPMRPTVRLEHERLGDRHIIHNYGHGGAGVSLSWGCADEVTRLVRSVVDAR